MNIISDDLGNWRRTHYSIDLKPELDNNNVIVFGWVSSIRSQGGIIFLIIEDKDGKIQVTAKKNEVTKNVFNKMKKLVPHTSIGVKGIVKAIKKAPNSAEIIPNSLKILGFARLSPPFNLQEKKLPRIDKRLEIRAVDLRRDAAQSIFKIRRVALQSIRNHFINGGYFEVNTPKIISSATEGGAALFPLLYYNKEAFLTQSPQLYKEELVMAFEKVFEIGPAFRAEQSRTLGHLSEFVSLDVEEAYVDYKDIISEIEAMTKKVIKEVRKKCKDELSSLSIELEDSEFKKYTYDEVLSLLNEEGFKMEWGEDFSSEAQKILGKINPSYYFITDWPSQSKPFYIKPREDDANISESFDFMHSTLEMASGGSRINNKRDLEKKMKEKSLNPKSFEYHLKVYEYGMPPHAGFGLGFERFIMTLTQQKNIREVAFFPRDQFHLKP